MFVIALLFIGACFDFGLGYEYFRFMRTVLFVVLLGCAIVSRSSKWMLAVFVAWAVIYNPFYRPFSLPRHGWEVVNVLTVIWLLWWLGKYVFSKKDEQAQADLERLNLETSVGKWQERSEYFEGFSRHLSAQLSVCERLLSSAQEKLKNSACGQERDSVAIAKLTDTVVSLKGKMDALTIDAANAQKEMQAWRTDFASNRFALGYKYEIYIAQTFEDFGWDVQLVGNNQPNYDLMCTNTKLQQKKFVECKCRAQGKTIGINDVWRLINFANVVPKNTVALYTSVVPDPVAKEALEKAGIEVRSNVFMPIERGKFVKSCGEYYYIPTDPEYRTTSLKKGKIKYFETTFEAVLAGYKRA